MIFPLRQGNPRIHLIPMLCKSVDIGAYEHQVAVREIFASDGNNDYPDMYDGGNYNPATISRQWFKNYSMEFIRNS